MGILRCLGTLLLLRLGGAATEPSLPLALQERLMLWLTAATVEVDPVTAAVVRWRNVAPGKEPSARDFSRIGAGQQRFSMDKAKGRLQQSVRARPDEPVSPLARAFVASDGSARFKRGGGGGGSVEFPCGLVANGFQLEAGMTLYFVMKPVALEAGDQAVGQRFFGHYPFGQFRFRDGRVAQRSDSAEYVLRASSGESNPEAGAWNLVAYRVLVDGPPQASLGGAPFADMSPLALGRGEGRPAAFSDTATVTLGGSNSDCSFAGEIGEVLVFRDGLDDDDAYRVASYLANRHGLAPPPAAAFNAPPPPDMPVIAMGSGLRSPADSHAAESLALLAQMEVLKAQLDKLMAQAGPAGRAVPVVPTAAPRRTDHVGSPALDLSRDKKAAVQAAAQAPPPMGRPPLTRQQQRVQGVSLTRSNDVSSMAQASQGQRSGKCSGGDAFGGVSVEGWSAPPTASFEVLQQWEDAHKATFAEIAHFDRGGKSLREFIHTKVNKLKLLRHKLFCAHA